MDMLSECLEAVSAQAFGAFETVILTTVPSLALSLPHTKVVELRKNLGFAGAANAGARVASAPLVAFLNDDAVPDSRWLCELVLCLKRHAAAASVASKVLRYDRPAIVDGAGDELTRSLKAYRRGHGEADDAEFTAERQVFSASGTACLWRRDVFLSLGGFDERFFAYYEDVDLGFRARLAGFECWYAPRAVVLHRGGATASVKRREFEYRHAVRNRWATMIKNTPRRWFRTNAAWIAAGEAAFLIRSLVAGNLPLVVAAYREVFGARRELRDARSQVQQMATVSASAVEAAVSRRFPPLRVSLRRHRLVDHDGSAGGGHDLPRISPPPRLP